MNTPSPSYILPSDVQQRTLIAALKSLDNDSLTTLIVAAEDMIDAYVGPQKHHWKDLNTDRVFPREQDIDQTLLLNGVISSPNENPIIPYQVSVACLRQVEWLFTQWWSESTTDELPIQQDVKGEDIGGDGSYSATYVRDGLDLSSATLSPNARVLLGRFRSKFAGIDVSDPLSPAPVRRALTSDQALPSAVSPYYGFPL